MVKHNTHVVSIVHKHFTVFHRFLGSEIRSKGVNSLFQKRNIYMKMNSGAIQMFQGMIVLKTLSSELFTRQVLRNRAAVFERLIMDLYYRKNMKRLNLLTP